MAKNEEMANTTYIDENGNKQAGVTQQSTDYWANQANYYQKAYDEAVASNNKAAAAAAEQALNSTNQQIAKLNEQYQGTNQELYRNYMNSQKNIGQQLAANGYTGGLAESSRIGLDASYQNALNANQQALANDTATLNAAYTNAQYQSQAAADQANANALQNLYSNQAALQQNQYAEAQQNLQNQATTMAAAGDFSGYLNLGYSQDQVDAMTRMWLAENPTYKSAWIAAHPVDAKRLGLVGGSSSGYGNGSGNGSGSGDGTGDGKTDGKTDGTGAKDKSIEEKYVDAQKEAGATVKEIVNQAKIDLQEKKIDGVTYNNIVSAANGHRVNTDGTTTMFNGTSWEFSYDPKAVYIKPES